jgi:transcription elongation factor Elf1
MQLEHHFDCPRCWARISMLLDLSVGEQSYVEDCEVCCHPLLIRVVARENRILEFEAAAEH